MVRSSQILEADVDDDPVQPGGEGPFWIEPSNRGEQLHEDLLSDVLGEVVVSDDSIRGTQNFCPMKLEENFQPRQVAVPTPKYGLPLPWLRHTAFHLQRRLWAPNMVLPRGWGKVR